MTKILLVEDDPSLGLVIEDNLSAAGFEVSLARDGQVAMDQFEASKFDICLLDVMLPKKDGFTLAEEIRKTDTNIPILFITAKAMEEDRLAGFRSGGDDYITKPFSMQELVYRIEVFLKRSKGSVNTSATSSQQIGIFKFDVDNLSLNSSSASHQLTEKEAAVLKFLCENKDRVIKRNELLEAVWGTDDYFLGRSMDVYISKLRKYLKEDPSIQISTIHGVGFRLEIK